MNKKAQGLSMNVIIIAAISLLVLIVLIVLVIRASNNINTGTSCRGSGGSCIEGDTLIGDCSSLEVNGESWNHNPAKDGKQGSCGETQICCVRTENAQPQQ